jgi:hypothetical protein
MNVKMLPFVVNSVNAETLWEVTNATVFPAFRWQQLDVKVTTPTLALKGHSQEGNWEVPR